MSLVKWGLFGIFSICLIVGGVYLSTALQQSGCHDYCTYTLDFRMADWMRNSLLQIEGVEEVYYINEETQTRIVLTQGLLDGIGLYQVSNYLSLTERNVLNNKARTTIAPDGQSPPLCLRDAVNGNINGVYSVNNQIFVLPNDVRCQ